MKGYNLPDNVSPNDPDAPWNERDEFPCDVCGEYLDVCICPECPRCGEVGNPDCYKEADLGVCGGLFGDENKQ